MEPYETFEHCGLTVELHYDDSGVSFSPRDADNVGIMFCQHRNYILGDAMYKDEEYELAEAAWAACRDRGYGLPVFERWLRVCLGASVVLPLYLYEHSGITMRTGSFRDIDPGGWDSGMVGVIFDTAKTRELTGAPLESIERQLESEVKYYAAYLEGSVYGYVVKRKQTCDLGHVHEEELDSCWGFLVAEEADMEYLRSEAKAAAESYCD